MVLGPVMACSDPRDGDNGEADGGGEAGRRVGQLSPAKTDHSCAPTRS